MGDLPTREALLATLPERCAAYNDDEARHIVQVYVYGDLRTVDEIIPVKGSERYERVVQRMVELSDRGVIFGDTALDIALAALREVE